MNLEKKGLTDISATDISVSVLMKVHRLLAPECFLPLTPAVFHILLALAEGEAHGYAIARSVSDATGGRMKMGPGTLYGTIKRLLDAGLIEESDERPDPDRDDERRRYYRLTPLGRSVAEAEAQRCADLVRMARARKLAVSPSKA